MEVTEAMRQKGQQVSSAIQTARTQLAGGNTAGAVTTLEDAAGKAAQLNAMLAEETQP